MGLPRNSAWNSDPRFEEPQPLLSLGHLEPRVAGIAVPPQLDLGVARDAVVPDRVDL
jgi:hypothetical protein